MIRINLLPFRAARKKDNVRRQVSVFFLALILCVSALVWFNLTLGNRTEKLAARISATEKELKNYQEINKEIAEIKRKLEILTAKINIIRDLEANRRESVVMLDSLTEIIVAKRMWFNSLSINEKIQEKKAPEKKGKRGKPVKAQKPIEPPKRFVEISVKGIAIDNKTVADFMTRLEKSNLYSNVTLQNLKQVSIRKVNLKEFAITFNKVQSEEKTQIDADTKIAKS